MKVFNLSVNDTDAIHLYFDDETISLQLRRNVPTVVDLGTPSFKAALSIEAKHAHELGLELLNVAQRFYKKRKADQLKAKKLKQSEKNGAK